MYAPVLKCSVICSTLAIEAHLSSDLHEMGLLTASLPVEVEENIYMKFPDGVVGVD